MDLSSPLRSLAPGLDSAVLEVLARTESALSVTQIARLAERGSRQGHALVIERLIQHRLVLAEPANRSNMYRLNRDHVLAPLVLSGARARVVILERLAHGVAQLDPTPLHASVFGSLARGEGGPDSDIDLLLVYPPGVALDEAQLEVIHSFADEVVRWTGNRLEYIAYTSDELDVVVANNEPIVGSWLQDAITLLGSPISELVRPDPRSTGRSRHESERPANSTRR